MLGWIGNIFIIIGLFFLNKKTRWPFIFSIIGEAIYIYYSYSLGLYNMTFICVVFAALAARNFFKWSEA
jgi:nicotinamide riboside transporter PnuC